MNDKKEKEKPSYRGLKFSVSKIKVVKEEDSYVKEKEDKNIVNEDGEVVANYSENSAKKCYKKCGMRTFKNKNVSNFNKFFQNKSIGNINMLFANDDNFFE